MASPSPSLGGDTASTSGRDPASSALRRVIVAFFMDVFGFSLLAAVLEPYSRTVFDNATTAASAVGWLTALGNFCELISNPFFGALADHRGRKPLLLLATVTQIGTMLLLAGFPSLLALAVASLCKSVTSLGFTMAMTMVADVSRSKECRGVEGEEPSLSRAESRNFGAALACAACAVVVGPVAGLVVGGCDAGGCRTPLRPFLATALVLAANAAYIAFRVPETLRPPSGGLRLRAPSVSPAAEWVAAARLLGASAPLRTLSLIFAATRVANGTSVLFVFYARYRLGFGPRDVALLLLVIAAVGAISLALGSRYLLPRLGERRALALGCASAAVQQVAFGLATGAWQMYLALVLTAPLWIAEPSARGLMAAHVDRRRQGALQGALGALATAGHVVGPPIAAALFAACKSQDAEDGSDEARADALAAAPYALSAALFAASAAAALRGLGDKPPDQEDGDGEADAAIELPLGSAPNALGEGDREDQEQLLLSQQQERAPDQTP